MYSRSVNTLMVLAIIATFMIAMYAALEWVRKRALARLGYALDERLSRVVFETVYRSSKSGVATRAPTALADFNLVRDSLSGYSLIALFDAFWAPLFIIVMAMVNWLFGLIAIVMIVLTTVLAVLNYRLSRGDMSRYQQLSMKSQEFSQVVARNSETDSCPRDAAADARPLVRTAFEMLGWQGAAFGRMDIFASATKFVRSYQMAGIYTVGTLLFLNDEATLANTFVAMTLMMRGLGPIDGVISNWKGYSSVLAALGRLDDMLRDAQGHAARGVAARAQGRADGLAVSSFLPLVATSRF